jgi:hypothetical protein
MPTRAPQTRIDPDVLRAIVEGTAAESGVSS